MAPRVVLFGYGNASRGDDALGPALVACAQVWLGDHPEADVSVLEDYQLQVEHALDVADADMILFVDADASCRAPFCLRRVTAARDESYTSHELSPEAVLHVVREITKRAHWPREIVQAEVDWLRAARAVALVPHRGRRGPSTLRLEVTQ